MPLMCKLIDGKPCFYHYFNDYAQNQTVCPENCGIGDVRNIFVRFLAKIVKY